MISVFHIRKLVTKTDANSAGLLFIQASCLYIKLQISLFISGKDIKKRGLEAYSPWRVLVNLSETNKTSPR